MAAGSASQHTSSPRPVALPADIWMYRRGSEPVRNLTFFSGRLGLAVSLLQFDHVDDGAEVEGEEPWDSYDQFTRDDSSNDSSSLPAAPLRATDTCSR